MCNADLEKLIKIEALTKGDHSTHCKRDHYFPLMHLFHPGWVVSILLVECLRVPWFVHSVPLVQSGLHTIPFNFTIGVVVLYL